MNPIHGNAEVPAGFGEAKNRLTVGISELKVSNDRACSLITHSLGPCIGLVVYDPEAEAAGLLHYQLPTCKGHEERARENPSMFGDMGIPLLLARMAPLGGRKERMVVGVFGGASMFRDEQVFKIGIQNARAAKKILWQQCMRITHEDTGGHSSRTVEVKVGNGRIRLHKEGKNQFFQ